MKILMVSMFSNHFFRWTEQLRDSGHEVYWIDVFDSNTKVEKIEFVNQIIGWRNKIKYPGRYKIKKSFPRLYDFINKFNQRKLADVFEVQLGIIQPDIVHSFVMYSACFPILKVMNKHKNIPWIYSAWGNDLFHYKNVSLEYKKMREVFPRLDFMFADCERDYRIAADLGFQGKYLGTFPTGGGYKFSLYNKFIIPFSKRNKILIKGYEHKFGRCNNVLKALIEIREQMISWEIVIIGANKMVMEFIEENQMNSWKNLTVLENIPHNKVLELMGQSKIYIGNSVSDGIPNTLLEAILMGAFPIQSNPGGATAEIIINGKNGLLIQDPESSEEIACILMSALNNTELIIEGVHYNNLHVKLEIERKKIQDQVLRKYQLIEQELKS